MSMITCPECENSVSDQASKCAYCGFPIKKRLKDFEIENGVLKNFKGKDKEVYIFGDITKIDDMAFWYGEPNFNCYEFTKITISEGIKHIGKYVLGSCRHLKELNLPKSIQSIDMNNFDDIELIYEVNWSEDLLYLGDSFFKLKKFKFPKKLERFRYDDSLFCDFNSNTVNEIIITNDFVIGDLSFRKFYKLNRVYFPSNIRHIGHLDFSECTRLDKLEIPDGVYTLKSLNFYGCNSLNKVLLPESIRYVGDINFCGCTLLETITIPGDYFVVGSKSFYDCKSLKSVKLPNTLEVIQSNAFINCISLTNLIIPNSVTLIKSPNFCNCPQLTLKVYKDSVAEEFAKNNNLHYEIIEE